MGAPKEMLTKESPVKHTLAWALAEFALGVRGDKLPQAAATAARMCVLDQPSRAASRSLVASYATLHRCWAMVDPRR
jgi:hypothetical protein